MRKLNYLWYGILSIAAPLAILLLSANLVTRVPSVYVYYFNDSQSVNQLYTDVTPSEFAGELASYVNFRGEEKFQVYEKNGSFRDPVFEKRDQKVMRNVRKQLLFSVIAFILSTLIACAIYIYLYKKNFKTALLVQCYIWPSVMVGYLVLFNWIARNASLRYWYYNSVLGGGLGTKSQLYKLLGTGFYSTFATFTTLVAVALLCCLIYGNYVLNKKQRLFS